MLFTGLKDVLRAFGFFDYYVNRKTGEKKFKLAENDVEVSAKFDDFCR